MQAQRPLGIDVSSIQGSGQNPSTNIVWSSVESSGIAFAWARASEGGWADPDFDFNEVNARTAGVLIGAYHYCHPEWNSADSEAAFFWSRAGQYVKNGALMPMLDVEQDLSSANPPYTKTTLSHWVNRWCQDIVNDAAAQGITVHPVIYTYPSYSTTWLDSTVTQWPLWMATVSPPQNPQTGAPALSPWMTWTVWQYSWSGSVPGIKGVVDQDVYNGTLAGMVNALVIGTVVITNQPVNVTITVGESATFSVGACGSGSLGYQWRFNQTNITGATAKTYTVTNTQPANAGGYSVLVTNSIGSALSATAFLSVLGPLTNDADSVLVPPNMLNWWPADGNPNDIYGPNNATPYNGLSYTNGKVGLAFHFDGSTSYLLVNGTADISPGWTVCLWVNRQDAPGVSAALMGDASYALKLEQYGDTARSVGLSQAHVADYLFNPPHTVPAGTWTHLAFVGTGMSVLLYTNGVLEGATNVSNFPLPRACIGGDLFSGGPTDFMSGSLDEIQVFNRALNGTEISTIYSAGSAGLVRAPQFTGVASTVEGQIQLSLRGQTGKTFTLYTSTNLLNWIPLDTMPNPTGNAAYTDSTGSSPQKFYRAWQP